MLKSVGFQKKGRYWVHEGLKMAIEAPASKLAEEEAPVEIVEVGEGLQCTILGIEDLIIDRMNACKHWKSEIDCEMARTVGEPLLSMTSTRALFESQDRLKPEQ